MLSEYDKELLTAFVDGEMTRRERKGVLRLLHESSEARAFLRDLQENAHLFKLVPHHKLDDAFPSRVLGAIAARGLRPQAAPAATSVRRWRRPVWAASAAAAAILLAFGLWLSLRSEPEGGLADVASLVPETRRLVVPFEGLAAHKEALRKELERDSVHLDLAVRNQPEAVKQLVQVLEKSKIEVIRSPEADAALRKGDGRTQYLVYAEGLRPEELVAVLEQLGSLGAGKKEAQPGFQTMTLTALGQQRSGGNQEALKEKAPVERFAVILINDPAVGESLDPKVERFLAERRETHPGARQVLVSLTAAV